MNIGINTRFLISGRILEGIGRYTFEIAKQLSTHHPEHQFYFFFDRPFGKEFLFSTNVTPIVLKPQARHPFLFYLWFEWSIQKALKEYKIDVFLSMDNFLSLATKVPQVVVIHDLYYAHNPENIPYLTRLYYQYFMPRFVKKATQIIAVSNFVKNDILTQISNTEAEKIKVAYNALPSHFNKEPSIKKSYLESPYFVVPGAIHQRKNTYNILKAFKLFIEETNLDFKIVFVGRFMWGHAEDMACLWKELAVKKLLVHVDDAEDQDMVNWISYAEALVYVSQFEGFGIPLLEGFECKVPVITSNNTSLVEVSGNAALQVDPKNLEEIKQAMKAIITNPELKMKLISNGIERKKDFSWKKSMEIIYESLLHVKQK